jgi:hypothetical protein
MDFHVESAFGGGGRTFRQLVPLIETQFRRIINRKHVLPAYKIRYRPLFVNAHMQPTARAEDYAHIRVSGYLTVTVCEAADLNYERLARAHTDHRVMCTVSIGWLSMHYLQHVVHIDADPFTVSSSSRAVQCVAVKLTRHSADEPVDLVLSRPTGRPTVLLVASVGGAVATAGVLAGDILLAINNVPLRIDQRPNAVQRLLAKTTGHIVLLVERDVPEPEHPAVLVADAVSLV